MGAKLHYREEIQESVAVLEELEGKQQLVLFRDRISFLRSLKSGQATTQKEACATLSIDIRQAQRVWSLYKSKGIAGLLEKPSRPGAPCKLSEEEVAALEKRLQDDDIQFLHEAVRHVEETYNKDYSLSGIHYLFKRMKVKKKTGRPVNIKQDKEAVESFKKSILR